MACSHSLLQTDFIVKKIVSVEGASTGTVFADA